MRTVGVEEELLLVEEDSGQAVSVAGRVLDSVRALPAVDERGGSAAGPAAEAADSHVDAELQEQQVETDTMPRTRMRDIEADLRRWRDAADAAARASGARLLAAGTSPQHVEPRLVAKPRYQRMAERFGLTTTEQLTCGCHVHVSVDSEEEAVAVLDRVRVRLAPLLAISCNSPFWQGRDSGYASYRAQAWRRWPTAGPTPVFGSVEAYRRHVRRLLDTGVPLDEHMLYFDARASHRYPTVEVRVTDVCMDVRDAVLVAALARALVDTAASHWRAGQAPPDVPCSVLELAEWRASRDGVAAELLDPTSCTPRPAAQVLQDLVEHVGESLRRHGDEDLVEERLADVLRRGTGADRQRAVLDRTGNLRDVVADAVRVTAGHRGDDASVAEAPAAHRS